MGAISRNRNSSLINPIRSDSHCNPSHSHWLRNINLIPIDYASRPRLRSRLTLLRLTLNRNPWAFGDRVSHSVYRYSCHHYHFCILQHSSQNIFNAPIFIQTSEKSEQKQANTERSATAACATRSFGSWLEPRYIFAARQLV